MADAASETIELGGSIILSGFSGLTGGDMVIVKKIVGNYAKKFSETVKRFESLSLTMKKVHDIDDNSKFGLHVKALAAGKPHTAEVTDKNLFFAIDKALKKIEKSLG
ncbi:hypothetical protein JXB02_00805 [Candidatus Woesearchaeota archaeon]|nr:hypothetical protein [Candidatus Woesearchaeota archaeon]